MLDKTIDNMHDRSCRRRSTLAVNTPAYRHHAASGRAMLELLVNLVGGSRQGEASAVLNAL